MIVVVFLTVAVLMSQFVYYLYLVAILVVDVFEMV